MKTAYKDVQPTLQADTFLLNFSDSLKTLLPRELMKIALVATLCILRGPAVAEPVHLACGTKGVLHIIFDESTGILDYTNGPVVANGLRPSITRDQIHFKVHSDLFGWQEFSINRETGLMEFTFEGYTTSVYCTRQRIERF